MRYILPAFQTYILPVGFGNLGKSCAHGTHWISQCKRLVALVRAKPINECKKITKNLKYCHAGGYKTKSIREYDLIPIL